MYFDLKLIILPALAVTLNSCNKTSKPNVVIIYADDLGFGDLNYQNPDSKVPTPYLDRLASQGMRFTDAHSASTVSSPSRYSLLTGRYHWRGHLTSGIVSQWGDLRDLKRDLWEGGHRVPFIVRYPGVIPAGSVSKEIICQTDLIATIAAFTDISLSGSSGEDSFDLSSIFKGEMAEKPVREYVIHHAINGNFAIRKENWLLIEAKTGEVSKEPESINQMFEYDVDTTEMVLYNLESDSKENKNLFTEYTEKVNELRLILEKTRKSGRSVPN